jgi:formyl-CoA transferase
LPPFGLADGVAAYHATFATMFAIYDRDVRGSGLGQYIDVALYAPLFSLLGYQTTMYDQLGIIQNRVGNRTKDVSPRNAYETSDGRWVALSAAAPSIAERVIRLTGGDEVADNPLFKDYKYRQAHGEEIDTIVANWIRCHTLEEVLDEFEKAEAAIAPVYDIGQIFEDPQYQARNDIITVSDDELGIVKMQNVFPVMSRTPGSVRHAAPRLGEHNQEILGDELGLSEAELAELRSEKVI